MKASLSKPPVEAALQDLLPKVTSLRREIHAHPELGYQETGTTGRIRHFLNEFQVPFCNFEHMTGGYVWIDCGKDHTVGFRADIDALPIEEQNEVDFKSCHTGVMHACGHDMHASIAAGLCVMLWTFRERLSVNVLVIFQPAEECNPTGGAKAVIKQEILEKYRVQEFYGLHMWPEYPVGQLAVKPGPLMASSDKLLIRVEGRKAHAAEPQKGIDAISIATEIITAVEHKIYRELNPFETVLVSIGSISTSGRYNIICDQVLIEGTIRCINPKSRLFVHQRIKEITEHIAAAYRGTAEVTIEDGYAPVMNDPLITEKFIRAAKAILGETAVHTEIMPSLIGEDFSFYGQRLPSMYFFMGCESSYPLHNEHFLPREETLEQALLLMTRYFMDYVSECEA